MSPTSCLLDLMLIWKNFSSAIPGRAEWVPMYLKMIMENSHGNTVSELESIAGMIAKLCVT